MKASRIAATGAAAASAVLVLSVPTLAFAYAESAPGAEEAMNGELLLLHADDFGHDRATHLHVAHRSRD